MSSSYLAYYSSPIGWLQVRCSETHLLSLRFVDAPDAAENGNPVTEATCAQLAAYFNGSSKAFQLPLQQEGTGFQTRVWDLLYQIPYGKTVSYLQLARQYGDPKAIRAVAAANGRNNLAIIIPCHRVIGSNATLTGYAGGLWRKKWLLGHEAKFHSGVQQLF